ncbi:MAG: alpha/beta hydrolase [Beijerinckiaceae bacterium]
MALTIDPALFNPACIDGETLALNAGIVAKLEALPDPWSVPAAVVRDRRARGLGPFPLPAKDPRARVITIPGPNGQPLSLRIIAPAQPKGAFLHIHGGGWRLGTADMQDDRLARMADQCGLACVSVDYRLAPEDPYPAAQADCEAAALWLTGHAQEAFGTQRLFIGGESAGAHLAVTTMVRLRDRHTLQPFAGASLIAGCYDLTMTPSARHFHERLILTTRDVRLFAASFVQGHADLHDPDVSPLYADLRGLPPALFTIGTRDALLDDSLFMAAKWIQAGNAADLAVWPGGAHVFVAFPCTLTEKALTRIDAFLNAH